LIIFFFSPRKFLFALFSCRDPLSFTFCRRAVAFFLLLRLLVFSPIPLARSRPLGDAGSTTFFPRKIFYILFFSREGRLRRNRALSRTSDVSFSSFFRFGLGSIAAFPHDSVATASSRRTRSIPLFDAALNLFPLFDRAHMPIGVLPVGRRRQLWFAEQSERIGPFFVAFLSCLPFADFLKNASFPPPSSCAFSPGPTRTNPCLAAAPPELKAFPLGGSRSPSFSSSVGGESAL